jgi:hypothetical protein
MTKSKGTQQAAPIREFYELPLVELIIPTKPSGWAFIIGDAIFEVFSCIVHIILPG